MASLSPLLLAALLWVPAGTLTCYGDSGQPVDWFVVYKLPAHSRPGAGAPTGLRYKYLDEGSGGWRDGAGSIDSLEGAVGRSLLPLYGNTSQLAFLLYNDQPPNNSGTRNSSSRGHTKGRQLNYTYPNVYAHKLEGIFIKKLPDLEEVVNGHHVRHRPWNSSVTLTSKAGTIFQSFAKFGKFGDDLYSGWLAEALGSNLQVQFWQHSPGILSSNCSGAQQVLDVTQIAFPGPAGPTFNTTDDHSKWCVAPEGPWACVGDMNRNCGEESRGGGILCTRLSALWKAFQPLVKAWEPCDRRAVSCLLKA
ncbi:PREDICTED: deoxyribonuclease-2-alpha isoform X2 [Miniopterus natalensis]|uniref:deoxyribonuclease-2-alpha isoform X2 n=1 Tax=Miniopterus natalensis TaxID=291302 RepID=UPI0007A6B814|nr:PREDICTED: deoxyribonuclease-2-alpha isoform X2 [Miniopterus natalensis]